MSDVGLDLGRRIVITGLAGSGKSTLTVALAARTGLPIVHLDLAYWKPGWVAPSESEWREKQRAVLAGDAWIADGNYRETLDLRLERAVIAQHRGHVAVHVLRSRRSIDQFLERPNEHRAAAGDG
ncbi:MAG: AAA family ATPase [Ilumatobacteraceae bacterium]